LIARIWHGWTKPENATAYENLLKEEIFVGIRGRHINGFKSIQLFRRSVSNEEEFVTLTYKTIEICTVPHSLQVKG